MAKVEIRSAGSPTTTHVFVDGREVTGIRAFELCQDLHHVPLLTLDIVCTELSVVTEHADVEAQPAELPRVERVLRLHSGDDEGAGA